MAQRTLEEIPTHSRIMVEEAARFEGKGKREIYNRLLAGDEHELDWALAPRAGAGPRITRIIDARSLTEPGRAAWTRAMLDGVQTEKQIPRCARNDSHTAPNDGDGARNDSDDAIKAIAPRQLSLSLEGASDAAMLGVPASEAALVFARLRAVRTGVNGDYRAAGFTSRRPHREATAKHLGISYRHYLRLLQRFTETITEARPEGDARALLDRDPGPRRGALSLFRDSHNLWMSAYITELYAQHCNRKQIYEKLLDEIERKQQAWGAAHIYETPSYATVCRLVARLDPIKRAAEESSGELKAACGYIDRSFEDLGAGEMWCIDEWYVDAGAYLESNWRIFGRPWIVTLLDARSKLILAWKVTFEYSHETVLDLLEEAIRREGHPDYFYSDKGSKFRGRLGRNFKQIEKKKLLGPGASILEQLGTLRRGPGAEKNPRGNPLERRHRIFADAARLLPTWCSANTVQRPESFDAQWRLHEAKLAGKADATPLLPLGKIGEWFVEVVDKYNHAPSSANGLRGLSPAAAYKEFSSDADRERRRVCSADITLAFAENFPQRTILDGGIISLPDGGRYSHASLLLIQGEKRDVRRARHDKSAVYVLPARKGEDPIIAPRRQRVGTHDPDALARQMEVIGSIRRIAVSSLPVDAAPRGEVPAPQALIERVTIAAETISAEAPQLSLHETREMTVEG